MLAELVEQIVQRYHGRRLRLAVDGVDGAGKSTFANELTNRLEEAGLAVVRASIDGFHRPKAERYRLGRTSAEGFYRESYDYQQLDQLLLAPFAPGGSGRIRTAAFDHQTDAPAFAPERQAGTEDVLILDGIFLHRPELRRAWDFSVFLHVGFDVSIPRCARRDGSSPDPHSAANRRYVEGQRLYLREAQPWEHATVIIDNTDLAEPSIMTTEAVRLDTNL